MLQVSGYKKLFQKLNFYEYVLFFAFFIISYSLMWKTFWIDTNGNMQIAAKVWSDFAATIPLTRSFSFGSNWPPQYPIFAGPPIRYHFVFFAIVGFLEKSGMPLDWALNSLSILGFTSLLILIYLAGKIIFKSRTVGTLSVIFFLFNSSLSFLNFFEKKPLSLSSLADIISNSTFASFGPYDGGIVSAFWTLNIYTNQRHLALAYAVYVFIILLIFKWNQNPKEFSLAKASILGIFVGFFPFIHLAVFSVIGITLIIFFLLYPKIRLKILYSGLIALSLAIPQIIYMGAGDISVNYLNPGYLIENLNVISFIKYWFFNLGILTILAPIGFVLADKNQRKIAIPFIILFTAGNIFQFSPEIAANHKFFNLFVLGADLFAAYFVTRLWKMNFFGKVATLPLVFFMIFSGIIDIFPITNDSTITLTDTPNNQTAKYIVENIPKDSTFLNSSFLYDPVNLAGRKVYLGWPYFSWSAGYDTGARFNLMNEMLSLSDKDKSCRLLDEENIDYIEIENPSQLENEGVIINFSFFENEFDRVFYDGKNISIYDVLKSCTK
jgi:hypothetical protein